MQTHITSANSDAEGASPRPFIGWNTLSDFPWRTDRRDPTADGYNRSAWEELILDSDTTVGLMSGISYRVGLEGMNGTGVLTNEQLHGSVDYLSTMYPMRVLSHCMVMPNDRLDLQLAMMERTASAYTHWKTYTPWGAGNGANPMGYWLDGMNDPDMVGPKMIQKGLDLGAPVFCAHKGFPLSGFSPTYSSPRDIGPAANMFPDAYLVVYHSAFEQGFGSGGTSRPPRETATAALYCDAQIQRAHGMWPEGPYDESDAAVQQPYPLDRGVNSLIKSLRDNDIGPNGTRLDPSTKAILPGTENSTRVYADLGAVWPCLMTQRVEEAMHCLGKLLLHVGEDRILWGTDCLWFGSTQPLIESFRCFEISEAFQERYGYPPLTRALKQKIFGQNAARLNLEARGIGGYYGKCHSDIVGARAVQRKRELDEEFGPRRDMRAAVWGPESRREFLRLHAHEEHEKRMLSGRLPHRG